MDSSQPDLGPVLGQQVDPLGNEVHGQLLLFGGPSSDGRTYDPRGLIILSGAGVEFAGTISHLSGGAGFRVEAVDHSEPASSCGAKGDRISSSDS